MSRKTKISILLLLAITITCSFAPYSDEIMRTLKLSVYSSDVHLILESPNEPVLPKHFRKTSDSVATKSNESINQTGLSTLNISGSHQFSEESLKLIKKSIGNNIPITSVDLRQESHGFINGNAVSWANEKNNANVGLTKQQVIQDEIKKLESIPLNKPITFYNHPKVKMIPTNVQNEDALTKSQSISYVRIPVTDGNLPADDMVDFFVEFVCTQPKNTWLHFHCKEGIGRTTTFMIMYDMMKNAKTVPADDIIKRQVVMANLSPHSVESFYSEKRISFLKKFYKYSLENNDGFKTTWSAWNKTMSLGYIKNTKKPTHLYVISQDHMTPYERTMIATLQGLTANYSDTQIYTLSPSQPDYQVWLDDLKDRYDVSYEIVTNP
jgi:protein-tyrosine phosphatase